MHAVMSPARKRTCALVALLMTILLDQWSKHALLSTASHRLLPIEITDFFNLVLVHNRGISFGVLSESWHAMPLVLTLFTSLVAVGLLIWMLKAHELKTSVPLGLIVGGAVGNIVDRLRFGSVTDFLDFHWHGHHWPAFNIADSAICIGVVILVVIGIVSPSSKPEKTT